MEAFDAALAAEFGDPEYFAVHHLTVSAYQVQHPDRFPAVEAAVVLRRFLTDGIHPVQVRREIEADSQELGREGGGEVMAFDTLLLSSVRRDDPGTYCADIERYARSVLMALGRNRPTGGGDG